MVRAGFVTVHLRKKPFCGLEEGTRLRCATTMSMPQT